MDVNNITIGEIVTAVTCIGIIVGFMFKIFSVFQTVKQNTKDIDLLNKRITKTEEERKLEKTEILQKVEETNIAVNLLCSAVSALIDNQVNPNGNKERLIKVQELLEEKKEIV